MARGSGLERRWQEHRERLDAWLEKHGASSVSEALEAAAARRHTVHNKHKWDDETPSDPPSDDTKPGDTRHGRDCPDDAEHDPDPIKEIVPIAAVPPASAQLEMVKLPRSLLPADATDETSEPTVSRPVEPGKVPAPAPESVAPVAAVPPLSVQPEVVKLPREGSTGGTTGEVEDLTVSRPVEPTSVQAPALVEVTPIAAVPPQSFQPELAKPQRDGGSFSSSEFTISRPAAAPVPAEDIAEIARESEGFTTRTVESPSGLNGNADPDAPVIATPPATLSIPNGTYAPAAGFSSAEVAEQAAVFSAAVKGGAYRKLDTQLAALAFEQSALAASVVGITSTVQHRALSSNGDTVLVDVTASDGNGAGLLATLQALGLESGSSFGAMASGFLPVSQVGALASLSSVAMARESSFSSNAGLVTTQDDVALASVVARTTTGFNGAGVTIGVLSDSFATRIAPATTMAQDIASNDLPASTTILQDLGSAGSDEGRGMAQLVHDLAPGSPIQFATAFTGQAGFANNIVNLWNAGSKVIVDDVFYFAEPAYQDGIIAQAVDQVVNAGAVYFSSAGNSGRRGYESAFFDSGVGAPGGGTLHDWQTLAGSQTLLPITVANGSTVTITLHWDQPSLSAGGPGAANDVDLYLYNSAGTLIAQSVTNNVGGDPFEAISGTNNTGSSSLFVGVGLFSGTAPAAMKLLMYDGSSIGASDRNTNDGTVSGHSAARNAVAVAAAPWYNTPAFMVSPPVIESFSSGGPTTIWYNSSGVRLAAAELRQTAQITASDGGNTTFFGSDIGTDADAFPNFFGTSAAAPNAAAVAALMLQARSTLTAADILNLQKSSATDMDNPATGGFDSGFDTRTGQGLVQADLAVNFAQTLIISGSTNRTQLFGTHFGDTITGSSAGDVITGYDGADVITGDLGGDTLLGGIGADSITAGGGSDSVVGGDDNDVLFATHADGNDTYTGGNGFDVLDFSAVNGVVQINQLAGTITGSAGNDTLTDVIEQIKGTAFGDVLSGGHGINVLDGEGGADQFFGNNGDDLMRGGEGDDTFFFSTSDGNDTLLGGNGFDILDYSSLLGVVQIDQLAGTTTGTANNDTLSDVFEMVIGTAFGDVLSGGHGGNSLKGNGGDDQFFANNGDDYVSGGTGNDTITGGVGNDTQDVRNGEGVDTWLDFTAGGTEDTITLTFYSGLGITTFAQLEASGRLSTVSGHAELALNGGDKIIFNNVVSHLSLTVADFIF